MSVATKYLTAAVALMLGFLLGFGASQYLASKRPTYEQGYQEALSYVRQRLESKGFPLSVREDAKSLTGRVVAAGDTQVLFEYDLSDIDLFREGMITKKLVLAPDVTIQYMTPPPSADPNQMFLLSFDEEAMAQSIQKLPLKDLKEGDVIQIESEKGIHGQDPIVATSAILLSRSSDVQPSPVVEEVPEAEETGEEVEPTNNN